MKTFYWLVKREFWENRGGFLWAPVITGGVFLLLNLMGIVTGEVMGGRHGFNFAFGGADNNMRLLQKLDTQSAEAVGAGLDMMMCSPAMIISIVMGFVVFFYCLGALYDDRRDRSLLFWKSLPISDTATVLSKVAAATVLAPLITVIVGALVGVLMMLMYAIALSFHSVSVWRLLLLAHPLQVIANLVGSIPLYLLWALPTVGWLMLCSAWARNKPFLWAVVLPVAVGIALGWFNLLGTVNVQNSWYWRNVAGRILLSVFPGGWYTQTPHIGGHGPAEVLSSLGLLNAYGALASPTLWIGVATAAAMLAAATWLRRWRDDS
ncbi:ABC-2 transporter permease [Frateuria defendens]|uniref:ABC-2 transporter permease n=1 Tax=Frateuria defendens TaxID=2219559 RepID=UPI00066FD2B9|nr:ABC-2 transporter permease [Frateuria defendens]